ncbi:MAG: hypothetical protein SNJ57_04340 [Cyanobacteriota bacterium]
MFALLFSNLTLGEELTRQEWIGVVLTLVSVYLVNQRHELAAKFAGDGPVVVALQEGTVEAATVNPSASSPTHSDS